MADNYFILDAEANFQNCIIKEDAEGVKQVNKLTDGVPLKDFYPDNAILYMDEDHPGMKLADFVANHLNYLIISDKVKSLLETESITNIEYLPISIYNQKKKCASPTYYIANILGTIDCLDYEKSKYRKNLINPGRILSFSKVILIEDKIPETAKIFRLKDRPSLIIIRKDLLNVLEKNNCTGIKIYKLNSDILV